MPSYTVSPEFAAVLERAETVDQRIPYFTWKRDFQDFVTKHPDECRECLVTCIEAGQDRDKLSWLAIQLRYPEVAQTFEDMEAKIGNEWTEA